MPLVGLSHKGSVSEVDPSGRGLASLRDADLFMIFHPLVSLGLDTGDGVSSLWDVKWVWWRVWVPGTARWRQGGNRWLAGRGEGVDKRGMEERLVLVTGGAGFIGANLVRHLLGLGYRVLTVDALTYAGRRESLEGMAGGERHELVVADIADEGRMREVFERFRPEWVLHLAAESHVDRSIRGPLEFVRSNVMGTAVLLEVALGFWRGLSGVARERFRWVQVSTDEVFGSLGEEGSFDEGSAYDPRSPYAASKAGGDHLVRAWWHTYGFPAMITNCSNNHGPFQHVEKLIPTVITSALRGLPIPVYGNGENTRDWLHVEDHCEALVRVALRGVPGETYLIGGGNEWRNLDLVRGICRWMGELLPEGGDFSRLVTFVEDRPGHDFRYAVDSAKIRRELGWEPRKLGEDAFRETVRWYVERW